MIVQSQTVQGGISIKSGRRQGFPLPLQLFNIAFECQFLPLNRQKHSQTPKNWKGGDKPCASNIIVYLEKPKESMEKYKHATIKQHDVI